ncbi:hypothetical protein Hanom_Chr08g00685081 [Helianthus anomalus]
MAVVVVNDGGGGGEVVMRVPNHRPRQQIIKLCATSASKSAKTNWVITQLEKDRCGPTSYKLRLLEGIFEVGIIIGQLVKLWIIKIQ